MHLRLHYFQSNCPDFPPQIGSHGYHKTAKPALEILANWCFSGPTGSQKGGCRTTRLAVFELNFEDETRKKPGGIHRAWRIEWWQGPGSNWWHTDFQSVALPTELPRHRMRFNIHLIYFFSSRNPKKNKKNSLYDTDASAVKSPRNRKYRVFWLESRSWRRIVEKTCDADTESR